MLIIKSAREKMRDYKLLGGSLWGLKRVKRARECENVLGKMKVILAFYVIIANKCSHINPINLLRNIITIFFLIVVGSLKTVSLYLW